MLDKFTVLLIKKSSKMHFFSPFNTKPNTANIFFLCVGALGTIAMQCVLDYSLGTLMCNFVKFVRLLEVLSDPPLLPH